MGTARIVIDAESTDETVNIARGLGAQVIVRPWRSFLEAREYALSLVRTPFAFFLDADEALDDELRAAILAAEPAEDLAAYRILRLNLFCAQAIYGAGWYPEYVVRLFRSGRVHLEAHPATASGAPLHERVVADGTLADLPGTLVHDSYPSVASYWRKFARYTALEAATLATSPIDLLKTIIVAALRFVWLLVGRRAMFDGWRGFIVAFGSALYPVAAHWKALRRA